MGKKRYVKALSYAILIFLTLSGETSLLQSQRPDYELTETKAEVLQPVAGEERFQEGWLYLLGGRLSSRFDQSLTWDEETQAFKARIRSELFTFDADLDPLFRLKQSVWRSENAELLKVLGYDRRITEYDPEANTIIIRYYLDGEQKEKKILKRDEHIIDSDLLPLYLEDLIRKEILKSNCHLILMSRGLKVKVDFNRVEIRDLLKLSPDYNYPAGFRDHLLTLSQSGEEFSVFVMDLTGIVRLFYPHKYYIVYRKELSYRFTAFWGGAPKDADFIFVIE